MLKRAITAVALGGAGVAWWVTAPTYLSHAAETALMTAEPDTVLGEQVFWAAGCASCHVAPATEESDAPILSGGQAFTSDFGTFYAPNISPSSEGIGGWTLLEFANAVQSGVSPDGAHYYPAFPYTAYAKAKPEDIAALYAFMQTLPADATASRPHEVGFPFNIRRSLGGWKFLFGTPDAPDLTASSPSIERGTYLAEALSHCTECHTERNALGGLDTSRWLGGAANPNGKGRIPNITPASLEWSEIDLMAYFTTGLTPDYDSAGGHMASVVQNLARLPETDRQAVVDYLKALPPVADSTP
ncbi:mono/diheme cytochrome c family protein [Litoreibacter halocynthiae]|uniref:Mono/diheme cytochrome c family protein n=1 Tax=Litoreibacter halocynthiae TaxID=1242689 RepID=A0A4R7LNL5_9RHOB|nr:cytochrome c [Litoreibacter halocynthiae]TDT77653.1 mono/diheme cytochrome c family protein [Litoreibacter halocynthiae]